MILLQLRTLVAICSIGDDPNRFQAAGRGPAIFFRFVEGLEFVSTNFYLCDNAFSFQCTQFIHGAIGFKGSKEPTAAAETKCSITALATKPVAVKLAQDAAAH